CAVKRARDNATPVSIELCPPNRPTVSCKDRQLCAGGHVPKARGPIIGRGKDAGAVRTEFHAVQPAAEMSPKHSCLRSGTNVPNRRGSMARCGHSRASVWAEPAITDVVVVARENR